MTYLPDIPLASISPKDQAPQIQTNFAQFATVFANNHTAIDIDAEGDHEGIIINKRLTDPGVTQDLDVIYCKDAPAATGGPQPQLFLQIPKFLPTPLDPSTPGNPPMQLTYNQVNTAGPIFQSFLPGGFLMYFGSTSNIAVAITLSPAPTKILAALAFPNTLQTVAPFFFPFDVSTQILTASTFKINSTLNGSGPPIAYSFTWIAIAQV